MRNAEMWTKIPNFCQFLCNTEYKVLLVLKCPEFRH